MRIQGWFPLVLTGLISLLPKRLSRVLVWSPCCPRDSQESSPTPQLESIRSLVLSLLYDPILTSSHDNWKTRKLDYTDHVGKVMSLLFNVLSRFVIAFLSRSQRLLISWLQSPSAVILEPKKIKSVTVSAFCHKVMDRMPWSCSIPQPLVLKKVKWNSSVKTYETFILMSVWCAVFVLFSKCLFTWLRRAFAAALGLSPVALSTAVAPSATEHRLQSLGSITGLTGFVALWHVKPASTRVEPVSPAFGNCQSPDHQESP